MTYSGPPIGYVSCAALCAYRMNDNRLEVLLTRRHFFNEKENRPARFPGEWVFPGGQQEEKGSGGSSETLEETAMREFREELGYQGDFFAIKELYGRTAMSRAKLFIFSYFLAELDHNPVFNPDPNGEILEYRWFSPSEAYAYILSADFTLKQHQEFRVRDLDDSKYGVHRVTTREIPTTTLDVLGEIIKSELKSLGAKVVLR